MTEPTLKALTMDKTLSSFAFAGRYKPKKKFLALRSGLKFSENLILKYFVGKAYQNDANKN